MWNILEVREFKLREFKAEWKWIQSNSNTSKVLKRRTLILEVKLELSNVWCLFLEFWVLLGSPTILGPLTVLGSHRVLVLIEFWVPLGFWVLRGSWVLVFPVCPKYTTWLISKSQKGAKRPHCNFDFMNKIEVRSNTVFYQLGRLNNTRAQTF